MAIVAELTAVYSSAEFGVFVSSKMLLTKASSKYGSFSPEGPASVFGAGGLRTSECGP